jgi:hypothetical protein
MQPPTPDAKGRRRHDDFVAGKFVGRLDDKQHEYARGDDGKEVQVCPRARVRGDAMSTTNFPGFGQFRSLTDATKPTFNRQFHFGSGR